MESKLSTLSNNQQLDNDTESGSPSKYQKHHNIKHQTNTVDIQVLRRIAKRYYLILLVAILFVCITLQNIRSYDYTSLFIATISTNDTLTILPRVDESAEKRILVNIDTPYFKIENDEFGRPKPIMPIKQANEAIYTMPDEKDWLLSTSTNEEPHDSSNKVIPKILHKVILTNTGGFPEYFDEIINTTTTNRDSTSPPKEGILIHAHLSWFKMNGDYDIRYYNLHLARLYLQRYYHPIFLRAFDCIEAFSGKTNLFRYLLVYREGGFYSDWKQECKVDGLLHWLSSDNTTWFSAFDQPYTRSNHMQNAFFGTPPQSPILARAINISLQKLQSRADLQEEDMGRGVFAMCGVAVFGQAFEDVANKNGWVLPHRGRKERNQHWEKIPNVRLGEFNYKQTNFQRFFYGDKLIIVHKCRQCGQHQDWPGTGECWNEYTT